MGDARFPKRGNEKNVIFSLFTFSEDEIGKKFTFAAESENT